MACKAGDVPFANINQVRYLMNFKYKLGAAGLALALAFVFPNVAMAESNQTVGLGSATARLDFRVIIPRVLMLQVGTAGVNNVDMVTFDYTTNGGDVGSTTAAAAITGNVVPIRVKGNSGPVTLTASTTGPLTNATSETIPWTEITSTSSDSGLPSPVIPATGLGAGAAVTVTAGTKVTDRTANWTFSYANNNLVSAGIYGVTNGRVTYTASAAP